MNESNGLAVRGTLRLLQRGDITIEQASEIVNMWIELTAKKFYSEGVLDTLRHNKNRLFGKSHQAMCDMIPENDEKPSLSYLDMVGVHSGLTGEKEVL